MVTCTKENNLMYKERENNLVYKGIYFSLSQIYKAMLYLVYNFVLPFWMLNFFFLKGFGFMFA